MGKNRWELFKEIFEENYIPPNWLIRKVLEEEESFESAVQRLSDTPLSTACYYIVSSPTNGTVIEREKIGVHGQYYLNDERWYLVQTNYNRDVPDPSHDYRRAPVEQRLQKLGQKWFTEFTMFDQVVSKFPSFNNDTIYSVVMNTATNFFNITVWWEVWWKLQTN